MNTGTLAEKIAALAKPMEQAVTVEVKLVGFDGDGYLGVTLGERDFAPYIEALRADVHAHVLRGRGRPIGGDVRPILSLKSPVFSVTADESTALRVNIFI